MILPPGAVMIGVVGPITSKVAAGSDRAVVRSHAMVDGPTTHEHVDRRLLGIDRPNSGNRVVSRIYWTSTEA